MEPDVAYWRPRVMVHRAENGVATYAIHEVYFDPQDRPVGWTEAAVSARFPSPAALKEWIEAQLAAPDGGVACGDLGYVHRHASFAMWREHVEEAPLEGGEILARR